MPCTLLNCYCYPPPCHNWHIYQEYYHPWYCRRQCSYDVLQIISPKLQSNISITNSGSTIPILYLALFNRNQSDPIIRLLSFCWAMLVEQRFEFEVIENAQDDVYFFLSINPFYLFDIIPNLRVPLFDRSIKKLIYWLTIALS